MEYEHTHRRAFAYFVDTLLIMFPIFAIIYIIHGTGENSDTLATIVSLPLFLLYMIYTEGNYGQSLGKKLLKLKVLKENGSEIGLKQAAIRNLLRIIDALPNFYIVGILAITFTEKHQRIGDLAAKTVVVRQ